MTEAERARQVAWRLKIFQHAGEQRRRVAQTCRYFGISRKTFYKWKKRYEADGPAALYDRSPRPQRSPTAFSSYGIYEVWCFLALVRALRTLEAFTWKFEGVENLLAAQGTGAGARAKGSSPWGELHVHFNSTFTSYTARGARARWSLSGERRPDLSVCWQPVTGTPCWLVADAKYRVDRNLVDAFESIHVYRDSLRWETFGGAARGAILLGPSSTPGTEVFFRDEYRAAHGIGAFELRPHAATPSGDGQGGPNALAEWIVATLGVPHGGAAA